MYFVKFEIKKKNSVKKDYLNDIVFSKQYLEYCFHHSQYFSAILYDSKCNFFTYVSQSSCYTFKMATFGGTTVSTF